MMINDLLRQLLYKKDCVIIPGLGGFVAHEQAAEIHPITHSFSPPRKKIAFNSKLTRDDGILTGSLVDACKITYSEAAAMVKEYVKDLKFKISTEKEVAIEGLGHFYHDLGNELQFELMDSKYNYRDKSFGLPELYHKPIERKEKSKAIPVIDRPAAKRSVERERRTSFPWVTALLGLLVLASIGTLFISEGKGPDLGNFSFISYSNEDKEPAVADVIQVEQPNAVDADEAVAVNETAESTVAKTAKPSEPTVRNSATAKPSVNKTSTADVLRVTAKSNRYYIIMGGFRVEKNAEKLSAKLRNEGNSSLIINPTADMDLYRVTLGDFDRLSPAVKKMEGLRNKYGNEIWVLTY